MIADTRLNLITIVLLSYMILMRTKQPNAYLGGSPVSGHDFFFRAFPLLLVEFSLSFNATTNNIWCLIFVTDEFSKNKGARRKM